MRCSYSHRITVNAGVKMFTGEFNAGGNPAMDWHPIQEEPKYS